VPWSTPRCHVVLHGTICTNACSPMTPSPLLLPVEGLVFRVLELLFLVSCFLFRIQGSEFRVQGFGFRGIRVFSSFMGVTVEGFGVRVDRGLGVTGFVFRVYWLGCS